MEPQSMGLKENLKRLRAAKGWTQAQTAEVAEVPFRSYQNWEAGTREPRIDALPRLAAALGATVDQLLADVEPTEEKK
ncbi:helix-turn-helix protein [Gemmata obscuriglobus]|uniref:XRE family transcriptional regulator n=1 Tax=Gemmata obscuriglobus TaxID=114 RepID=A0A2Z3H2N3_9BACT|nr:helix-turn-helix transcriptional regulator [Gemmata obscuriglobus]AWM40283.1 XRE family transcriptional regulator [Gemmata obscuriglobus]QEG26513.1 helix-turn-helix protein [Gemmata obscuriglobus]VTS01827.1 transcriptional regulator : MerR family transcriptional regulator OS=Bacillus gaemokensis GN=BAGA_24620 PE=4 SV=1: HTH_3 [Gemmata obscuriglobus UQM 2246]